MATQRTESYPRDQRGYQTAPDPVTALGIFGKGTTLPMLAAQESFTFGCADACDLQVDEKYLASIHARLDRIVGSRGGIRVTNVSSGKNDIVHNGEIAESEFEMGAGEWFDIGDTRYYALNDEMRLARPKVMEVLGVRQHKAIDELLIAAVKDSTRHVLLLGEPGCDQERLGRVIHQVSHRRHNRFHPLPDRPRLDSATRQDIVDANNGTIIVPLYQKGKLEERVASALVHPEAKLRLIICARSPDKIAASFPAEVISNAKHISISPLRERKGEIAEILDQWFIVRRSQLRFSALRPDLRESLLAHNWPDNLRELRETVDHLVELAHYNSGHQATMTSRVTRGVFRNWLKKLNLRKLTFPLLPQRDSGTGVGGASSSTVASDE